MTSGERRVALLLVTAAVGWMARPLIEVAAPKLALSDAGIAVSVAVMLFIVPGEVTPGVLMFWRSGGPPESPLLTWDDARQIRWDVLSLPLTTLPGDLLLPLSMPSAVKAPAPMLLIRAKSRATVFAASRTLAHDQEAQAASRFICADSPLEGCTGKPFSEVS